MALQTRLIFFKCRGYTICTFPLLCEHSVVDSYLPLHLCVVNCPTCYFSNISGVQSWPNKCKICLLECQNRRDLLDDATLCSADVRLF
jgi:hypothetical protein